MAQELKLNDALNAKEEASESAGAESEPSTSHAVVVESEAEDEQDEATLSTETGNSSQASKKKKSKRKRIKAILTGGNRNDESTNDPLGKAVRGFSEAEVTELLAMNPALAKDLGIEDGDDVGPKAAEALKNLSIPDIMTGMTVRGKNVKDMASYKFWGTQPVPKFDDKKEDIVEGPFKIIDPEKVPKAPNPLPEGFEWTTLDLTTEKELKEVHDLLNGHYVEDKEAMFRFSYSESFLKWALMSPGWKKEWHIGVRASKSQKLVAFISAVPVALRIRQATLCASEVNFLCVHKKLRTKRLAPVLIKEITRQCNLMGISQAIYTAGVLLPTPVSTCRYFHRSLDWQKLYEVGFSPLPQNSKPQYQTRKYALPDYTAISGLRPMQEKDVDAVHNLLKRYLAKFDMAPVFTREEVNHWLLHKENSKSEQVIWSYVVEDPVTKKITDYFSFYALESTVIGNAKYSSVRAAYLYYYASETGLEVPFSKPQLKARLNALINDALILAKRFKHDVFNALTLMDNALFLEQQKFGRGDGQLHYYLYNYNANRIAGGVDRRNDVDEERCSGVAVAML